MSKDQIYVKNKINRSDKSKCAIVHMVCLLKVGTLLLVLRHYWHYPVCYIEEQINNISNFIYLSFLLFLFSKIIGRLWRSSVL
jgi:hypothetical protein